MQWTFWEPLCGGTALCLMEAEVEVENFLKDVWCDTVRKVCVNCLWEGLMKI